MLFVWLDNIKRFGTTEADPDLRKKHWKKRGDGQHRVYKKEKDFLLLVPQFTKEETGKVETPRIRTHFSKGKIRKNY